MNANDVSSLSVDLKQTFCVPLMCIYYMQLGSCLSYIIYIHAFGGSMPLFRAVRVDPGFTMMDVNSVSLNYSMSHGRGTSRADFQGTGRSWRERNIDTQKVSCTLETGPGQTR